MDFGKLDLNDNQKLARIIILAAADKDFSERRDFEKFRNAIIKQHKASIFHNLYFVKAYRDLISEGLMKPNLNLLKWIQKRGVRTMSGVAPLTVLTKPFPCPGRCVYCPTDVRMPKSYLPSQPAAQRGFRQRFNPYTQVFVRLKALAMTGHEISKVELRVLGGTWSSYPKKYQTWFLKRCLQAMNEFGAQVANDRVNRMRDIIKKTSVKSAYGVETVNTVVLRSREQNLSWEYVVKENENAAVRCIGINIETRPDHIDYAEVRRLRKLGVTKVELGVQTTDDHVQELTKRGHDLKSVVEATRLLKDAGFKISYHMMPNLPGSNPDLDKRMIYDLFRDDRFQPDYLKIYPCMVVPKSVLAIDYRKGLFTPYSDEVLEDILLENMRAVPYWCRVDRVARDIPATDIEAGSTVSNIRQVLEKRLLLDKTPSKDIRSREVMGEKFDSAEVQLVVRSYAASGGVEHFLAFEHVERDRLVALLRLRFPGKTFIKELAGAALIREVHVYGKQIAVGSRVEGERQHIGWGGRLMMEAEKLAKKNGFKKMAVIAGIGTREYYKKRGYKLEGSYMVRYL